MAHVGMALDVGKKKLGRINLPKKARFWETHFLMNFGKHIFG